MVFQDRFEGRGGGSKYRSHSARVGREEQVPAGLLGAVIDVSGAVRNAGHISKGAASDD